MKGKQALVPNFMVAIALLIPIAVAIPFGATFDLLFYQPFDYAYYLFATICFVAVNVVHAKKEQLSVVLYGSIGAFFAFCWFVFAMLLFMQIHIVRGGSL